MCVPGLQRAFAASGWSILGQMDPLPLFPFLIIL